MRYLYIKRSNRRTRGIYEKEIASSQVARKRNPKGRNAKSKEIPKEEIPKGKANIQNEEQSEANDILKGIPFRPNAKQKRKTIFECLPYKKRRMWSNDS